MEEDVILSLWTELKPHIAGGFTEAADVFINVLVEHDVSLEELYTLTTDMHIKNAIRGHVEIEEEEEEEEEEDYYADDYE